MSLASFNNAERETIKLIEAVASVDDLHKRGELNNYKYDQTTGKIEPKATDDDIPDLSQQQLIQQAVDGFVQKLRAIPAAELNSLQSFSGRMSILSTADQAGTFLKADQVVLDVLRQDRNLDPNILRAAEDLLVQEAALLKMQSELFDDFTAYKQQYLAGLPSPSPLQDMPAFFEKLAKGQASLANLKPQEKRILSNLIASDRELIALERKAENLSQPRIVSEIGHLRKLIGELANSTELQMNVEFDNKLNELQSKINITGGSLTSIGKELTELHQFLFAPINDRSATAVSQPTGLQTRVFNNARAMLPDLRSLFQLMTEHKIVSEDVDVGTLQRLVDTARQIDDYRTIEEALIKQGVSLTKLVKSIPALDAAFSGGPLLANLQGLSTENIKALGQLQKFGPKIKQLYEGMGPNEQAANKNAIGGLLGLLGKIHAATVKQVDEANHLLLRDKLPGKLETLNEKEISVMATTADDLAELSSFLPHPSLVTTSQLLYHKTATAYMHTNKFIKAMGVLRQAADQARFEPSHPLTNVQQRLPMPAQDPKAAALGMYVGGMDTGGVKERAPHASVKRFETGECLCFDFKLNHHARQTLHEWSDQIVKNGATWKASLPVGVEATITEISAKEGYIYPGRKEDGSFSFSPDYHARLPNTPSVKIAFKGLGEITICPGTEKRSLNDWINVTMPSGLPPGEALRRLNLMLTLIGCPPSVVQSREIDLKRNEIMGLYRSLYPADAFKLEKSPGCFDLSLNALRAEIVKRTPGMTGPLQALEKNGCQWKEGFQGKMFPAAGIAKQMKDAGAFGLMIGMNDCHPDRIGQVLKGGFLSCQQRYGAGIIATGASNYKDHELGGAESVFTRLITSRLAKIVEANGMPFGARVQILIDLEAADASSTYCFSDDAYGTRVEDIYAKRKNLIDLTRDLETVHTMPTAMGDGSVVENPQYGKGNEIMIRDYLSPKMIRGILVQSQGDKKAIVAELERAGLVEVRSGGRYVFGKPLDQFIQVGNQFKKEMWDA